jgi:uncharacterized DUF497 family protein
LNGWQFEWDPDKAEANRRKHGVTFDEAATVFDDPNAQPEYDERHSADEDRWLVIGLSSGLRLLTVAYTKRNETIRLISAHRATKAETRRYTDAG